MHGEFEVGLRSFFQSSVYNNWGYGLDFRAIFTALSLPILYWSIATLGVTALGQPGVICITPLAWLLALVVGRDCVRLSKSEGPEMRLAEAGLAGAILGLVEGALLPMISALIAQPDEILAIAVFSLVMGLVGMLVCAVIAAAFAAFLEGHGD